eukprot:1850024-Heterocapsa_arctica.AAC.1
MHADALQDRHVRGIPTLKEEQDLDYFNERMERRRESRQMRNQRHCRHMKDASINRSIEGSRNFE